MPKFFALVFFLSSFVCVSLFAVDSSRPLHVKDGVLDLTSWDGRSSVSLDGDWRFAWKDWGTGSFTSKFPVPGSWPDHEGWATYRLQVLLSDRQSAALRELALQLPLISTASRVFWNGHQVWETGKLGTSVQEVIPVWKTGVVSLEAHAGENLLIVQVANFHDVHPGLIETPKLGLYRPLLEERQNSNLANIFLFGCLFIMGLYHLGLFAYRPKDTSPLFFGLLSLLLGVRGLLYGEVYVMDIVPGLPWEILMKAGYLTFSLSTLFFSLFIRSLFPESTFRFFTSVSVVGTAVYSVAILVTPAPIYTFALPFFQMFVGLVGVSIIVILIRAILDKRTGARLFFSGFLLFFAAIIHDILKTNLFLPTPFVAPLGLLSFLFFQSLVMIRKFSLAFNASERYSQHLARINTSLERFIPREVLSFLQKESIVEIELGDHIQRPMTVLFADIRDFTTLSETMNPEENFRFINSYLRRMGPVVRRNSGFVDKYLGDGIMALFPEEPHTALDAALELRVALAEYNSDRAKSGYSPIRVGIGIHRGPLMLGTIGENRRMDSTVISDTVNAASRLEGLTKKFQRDILVSGETLEALDPQKVYRTEFIEEQLVKGKVKPLKVFALVEIDD